jgi:hypothetical protein
VTRQFTVVSPADWGNSEGFDLVHDQTHGQYWVTGQAPTTPHRPWRLLRGYGPGLEHAYDADRNVVICGGSYDAAALGEAVHAKQHLVVEVQVTGIGHAVRYEKRR